jgi:hypothetical protein
MGRTGVAEAVRTVVLGLNAQRVEPAGDRVIHATRRKWAKRSFERHEDFPGSAPRPSRLEISQDRVADGGHERIILCPSLLGPLDRDYLSGPVQVFETQSSDFATSQSINCKQHQDCVVTRITRTLSDGAFHEPLHVNPARTSWETILFEEPWRVDGSGNSRRTPPPHLSMSKERAQRCRARCDRHATPAVSTSRIEKGINIVDGDVRDRRFGGGDVPQESFDLPTSMSDSARRQPAFVPQMGNEIVNLVRMDIQLAVWRHRQQFEKAQPVGGDLNEQLTLPLSPAPASPQSLMAYPLPSGRFDLQPGNLMASGHIKPLSNHKQFTGNMQQGLASKALAGTMREIACSLSRPRTRLVTRQDSRIGEQSFEHGSDVARQE